MITNQKHRIIGHRAKAGRQITVHASCVFIGCLSVPLVGSHVIIQCNRQQQPHPTGTHAEATSKTTNAIMSAIETIICVTVIE